MRNGGQETWPVTRRRQLHLNLFMTPSGYHGGSWRLSDSGVEEIFTLEYLARITQQMERAKLDAVFIADFVTIGTNAEWARAPRTGVHEPLMSMAALAGVTSRIGLIASASTSFSEPYNVARQFAALDHLSNGRAAWNIVTSYAGEENFAHSQRLPSHEERYKRATEYVRVVTALWDSWEDSAVVNDRSGGSWALPERLHAIDFQGEYFTVKGPLNIARPPQGWPVLVQAGASADGKAFAAAHAEVVFTVQSTLEGARRWYREVKQLARANGRDPAGVKILPGLLPIIGETEADARRIAHELAELADFDVVRHDLQSLIVDSGVTNFNIEDLDYDEPIPLDRLVDPSAVPGNRSRYEIFHALAASGHTLEEVLRVLSVGRGHPVVIGTAQQVADVIEQWFLEEACDGFQLQASHYFAGLDAISGKLVPELQRRGLFRTEYPGTTLRESYDLPRPPSRSVRTEEPATRTTT